MDDDHDIRESLIDAFGLLGYTAHGAANGQEAMDRLKSAEPPCLILLDLMMPVMSGQEFREHQMKDPKLAKIPVVVITADGHAGQKAEKMQAAAGLSKPLDFDALCVVAEKYCGQSAV